MRSHYRSIAILAANPAFASILSRALEEDGGFDVASFTSIEMLTTYLRTAEVHVLVLDTDLPGAPAVDIARGLRTHMKLASPDLRIVALTRSALPFHKPLLAAGIDAVLSKPVVPVQLLVTVEQLAGQAVRLAQAANGGRDFAQAFETRSVAVERVGNVIPLFGEGRVRR